MTLQYDMLPIFFPADTFGDRFELGELPLPRPAAGYAIQMLDTDTLFDRRSGDFLPVRSPSLDALFPRFDDAFAAASQWVEQHCATVNEHHLSIVPAGYDEHLERHILIYGVLRDTP